MAFSGLESGSGYLIYERGSLFISIVLIHSPTEYTIYFYLILSFFSFSSLFLFYPFYLLLYESVKLHARCRLTARYSTA